MRVTAVFQCTARAAQFSHFVGNSHLICGEVLILWELLALEGEQTNKRGRGKKNGVGVGTLNFPVFGVSRNILHPTPHPWSH